MFQGIFKTFGKCLFPDIKTMDKNEYSKLIRHSIKKSRSFLKRDFFFGLIFFQTVFFLLRIIRSSEYLPGPSRNSAKKAAR